MKTIAAIKEVLSQVNAQVKQEEMELNALVRACATELARLTAELKVSHQRMSGEIALKLADLKARGLATDIPGLEGLLRQKTAVAREIAMVEQRIDERQQCRDQRTKLRAELQKIRGEMTTRRKTQLKAINANLGATIRDYTIFVKYDDAGITAEFEAFMQAKMTGTYLQDNVIGNICRHITPSELADLILEMNRDVIAAVAQIIA